MNEGVMIFIGSIAIAVVLLSLFIGLLVICFWAYDVGNAVIRIANHLDEEEEESDDGQ